MYDNEATIFHTRTLRPLNEVLLWFKELTEVRLTRNDDGTCRATLTDFDLSANGPTDISALRQLGDKMQAKVRRLVLTPDTELNESDFAKKRLISDTVDLIASGLKSKRTLN